MTTPATADPRRKRTIAGALLALAGAMLALALTPAFASAHHGGVRVSGTYTVTDFGATTCAPKGQSPDILKCTTTGFTSAYDGNLVGTSTVDFTQIIDCATSRTRGRGIETFTGSLDGGREGTLTWKIVFRARLDCATFAPSEFHGLGLIRSSSGALARTHGLLRFGDVTYEGVLR